MPWSRLRGYGHLLRHYRASEALARFDYDMFLDAKRVFDRYAGLDIKGARILDIGCGQRFPVPLLFHAAGARAIGIDTAVVGRSFSALSWSVWRKNGLERSVKTLAMRVLFDPAYHRELGRLTGRTVDWRDVDVRVMDARHLDLPDSSIDFAYSNAVFQSIDGVAVASQELRRVLRSGGVAAIGVHLFPSLSGGQHWEWAFPQNRISRTVPPWDHLRSSSHPVPVYLNKLRERDYREIFEANFELLDVTSNSEGAEHLTAEIERELSRFEREDLLMSYVRFVMRKRLN